MSKDLPESMSKPIICVDFDGVIHSYTSGWKGEDVVDDPPVPGALQWLVEAASIFDVRIYSSRSKSEAGRDAMRRAIYRWSVDELGDGHAVLSVVTFASEKPAAFLTIDDRAVCFDGDWNKLDPKALRAFKPWHQMKKDRAHE